MSEFVFDTGAVARFSEEKYQKVNLYESHRLFCDVYCLLPGQSQRAHVHNDEDKIYQALTGPARYRLAVQRARCRPVSRRLRPQGSSTPSRTTRTSRRRCSR